jgi:alpha-1,3-glucosyltransferase
VVNACFGAAGFGMCYLWCTWKLILKSGLLDKHLRVRESQDSKMSPAVESSVKKTR